MSFDVTFVLKRWYVIDVKTIDFETSSWSLQTNVTIECKKVDFKQISTQYNMHTFNLNVVQHLFNNVNMLKP